MASGFMSSLVPILQEGGGFESLVYYMFIVLMLFFIISMFFSMARRRPTMAIRRVRTITVLQCENCDYKEERDFQVGDYVFKKAGECAKCKGTLYISMIYGMQEKT